MTSENPDSCAHCGHVETVHVNDGHRLLCQRCLLLRGLQATTVSVYHEFESMSESEKRKLRQTERVYALHVGATFNDATGYEHTVARPCLEKQDGWWLCVTHLMRFNSNVEKDFHCYLENDPQHHAMIWACRLHGAEHPGEQSTGGLQH